MKIKIQELRQIIREALNEDEEPKKIDKINLWKKMDNDSMDSEVDNFFAASIEENKENELDLEKYSREVFRLINNYDSLLDTKEIIMRRALNYIGENYGKDKAKRVEDVLSKKFSLNLEDNKEDPPAAPTADRAGPGLGG